jgi:hypothetical protein
MTTPRVSRYRMRVSVDLYQEVLRQMGRAG